MYVYCVSLSAICDKLYVCIFAYLTNVSHVFTLFVVFAISHPLDVNHNEKKTTKRKAKKKMDNVYTAYELWSTSEQIEPEDMEKKSQRNENNLMMAKDECRVQIKANYMVEYADTSSHCGQQQQQQ